MTHCRERRVEAVGLLFIDLPRIKVHRYTGGVSSPASAETLKRFSADVSLAAMTNVGVPVSPYPGKRAALERRDESWSHGTE